jgi:hypothetical protein
LKKKKKDESKKGEKRGVGNGHKDLEFQRQWEIGEDFKAQLICVFDKTL